MQEYSAVEFQYIYVVAFNKSNDGFTVEERESRVE